MSERNKSRSFAAPSTNNLTVQGTTSTATSTFTVGSNTSANATIQLNVDGSTAANVSIKWRKTGVEQWRQYMAGLADTNLYIRDMVNARMQVTYTPGTTALLASTEFGSQVLVDGPLRALGGVQVKEGTNAVMGSVTLVGGSAVVATTAVTASSRIQLTGNVDGGTPGWLRVSTRTAGTSFTITSSSGTDTSTVAWLLVEPA